MIEYKNRKTTRLSGADYSSTGVFFLTICTKERQCSLSRIVGTGVLDGPGRNDLILCNGEALTPPYKSKIKHKTFSLMVYDQ